MEKRVKSIFSRYEVTVIAAVLILSVIFAVVSKSFLSAYNLFNMSRTASLYIFIALGQAMSLIVGGMNLSLGQIGGLTVVIAGFCMQDLHMPILPAMLIGLVIGSACGLVNGIIITKFKLNSFVVTLATSFIYGGLINGITEGMPFTEIPQSVTAFSRFGFLGIPLMLWLSIAVLGIVGYLFKYSVTGRRLLATGGNLEAAKMSAVNTDRTVITANVLSGFFGACAGVMWITFTGSAQPSTGSDWMLISFAVAVIGGTSLKGGVINPIGLFFSSLLLVMVSNGLVMINANIYYEQTYLGLILLLAVALESIKAIVDNRRNRHLFLLESRNRHPKDRQKAS